MASKMFTQCLLKKITNDDTIAKCVSWIPSDTAKEGYTVMLKEESNSPPILFKVLETYSSCERSVLDQIRKNKNDHRKATDI